MPSSMSNAESSGKQGSKDVCAHETNRLEEKSDNWGRHRCDKSGMRGTGRPKDELGQLSSRQ